MRHHARCIAFAAVAALFTIIMIWRPIADLGSGNDVGDDIGRLALLGAVTSVIGWAYCRRQGEYMRGHRAGYDEGYDDGRALRSEIKVVRLDEFRPHPNRRASDLEPHAN